MMTRAHWIIIGAAASLLVLARKAAAQGSTAPGKVYPGKERYPPFSGEAISLFQRAAIKAGLPADWATSFGLHSILKRESDGYVGRPNYTYGARSSDSSRWSEVWAELKKGSKTTKSSATGLGQLILGNVETYYPTGRAGIGNALEEAVGMLRYIKARYGTPDNAWAKYGTEFAGY